MPLFISCTNGANMDHDADNDTETKLCGRHVNSKLRLVRRRGR